MVRVPVDIASGVARDTRRDSTSRTRPVAPGANGPNTRTTPHDVARSSCLNDQLDSMPRG